MLYLPDCAACMAYGDPAEPSLDGMVHGEVVYDAGDSSNAVMNVSECEWENEDCPDRCRTEHDEPSPDSEGQWECSDTGTTYNRCDLCNDWNVHHRYGNYPVEIDGEWVCDPYEHSYSSCEDCGEYVPDDSLRSVTRGRWDDDAYLCNSCYREFRDEQRERSAPPTPRTCSTCNTPENFLDELTERFVCEHEADNLRRSRKPVLRVAA